MPVRACACVHVFVRWHLAARSVSRKQASMLHVRACTPPACPHAHVHKCIHAMECAVAWRHWFTASSSSTAAAPSPISPPPSSALSAPAASDAWSRRETGRWEQRGCVGASSPGDGSAGPRCCCARQLSVAVREGRHRTGVWRGRRARSLFRVSARFRGADVVCHTWQ